MLKKVREEFYKLLNEELIIIFTLLNESEKILVSDVRNAIIRRYVKDIEESVELQRLYTRKLGNYNFWDYDDRFKRNIKNCKDFTLKKIRSRWYLVKNTN